MKAKLAVFGILSLFLYYFILPVYAQNINPGNGTIMLCANTNSNQVPGGLFAVLCDSNGRFIPSPTVAPSSAPTATGTTAVAGSGVSNLVAKSSSGNLLNAYATSSSAGWLFVINATSLPSNSTLTVGTASGNLQGCFELAKANTDYQGTINYNSGPWEAFTVGIVIALSSTACPTLTVETTSVFIHAQVQ